MDISSASLKINLLFEYFVHTLNICLFYLEEYTFWIFTWTSRRSLFFLKTYLF